MILSTKNLIKTSGRHRDVFRSMRTAQTLLLYVIATIGPNSPYLSVNYRLSKCVETSNFPIVVVVDQISSLPIFEHKRYQKDAFLGPPFRSRITTER